MQRSNMNIPATVLKSMEKGNQVSAIESIFERIKSYLETRIELIKLKSIDKSSSIVSSLITYIVLIVIFGCVFFFLNIAIALVLGELLGKAYYGFLILAGFYTVVGIILLKNRDRWLKTPAINMMVKGLHD